MTIEINPLIVRDDAHSFPAGLWGITVKRCVHPSAEERLIATAYT